MLPPADPFALVGSTIAGRYRVDALVAEGGFGVIYRGFHLGFERAVAIKCLKMPANFTPGARERFWQRFREEGKLLARLSEHPSIVRIFDVAATPGEGGAAVPYLVLEWLEGQNLEAVLAERLRSGRAPFSEREALSLLRPVVDAMRLAHAHGIAHRDLKPANLFLCPGLGGPTLKVLDFGVAKAMQAGEVASEGVAKTSSGFSAFSPNYGAPEQFLSARFGPTGPWTDVHALGLILVELVTGVRAMADVAPSELVIEALAEERPTPRTLGAKASEAFEALCARALAREPRERYPDAGALLVAIDAVLAGSHADPTVAGAPALAGSDPMLATSPTAPAAAAPQGDALDTGGFLARENLGLALEAPAATLAREPQALLATVDPDGASTAYAAPVTANAAPRVLTAAAPTLVGVDRTEPPNGARPAPARTALVPSAARAPARRAWLVAGAGLAILALGIGLGVGLSGGGSSTPASAALGSAQARASAPVTGARASVTPSAASAVLGPDDMVLVPAGEFTMGCAEPACHDDEKPPHPVRLGAFWLDRTEVTVAAYARCASSGSCSAAEQFSPSCNAGDRPDHPMNCITWAQADAYCRFAGKRLPTEAEWERAARGDDARSYPWGERAPSCELAVIERGCGRDSTAPVGSKPAGTSPYGALDLIGNVREWLADGYDPAFYGRAERDNPLAPRAAEGVTRGGGWRDAGSTLRAAARGHWKVELAGVSIGVRCARDAARGGAPVK